MHILCEIDMEDTNQQSLKAIARLIVNQLETNKSQIVDLGKVVDGRYIRIVVDLSDDDNSEKMRPSI